MQVELTDYEVANLASFLMAVSVYNGHVLKSPLRVGDSGDWLGQLLWKLGVKAENGQLVYNFPVRPNFDPYQFSERARDWINNPH